MLMPVPGGDISTVGWVERSDTSEIEGFLYRDITPKPEADIRIAIGKAYEAMQDERRLATEAFTEDLRATGLSVDLEITERQPGRVGLGPIEWTAIFVGPTVATSLVTNLTNDLYAKAKQMLLSPENQRWKAKQRVRDFRTRRQATTPLGLAERRPSRRRELGDERVLAGLLSVAPWGRAGARHQ